MTDKRSFQRRKKRLLVEFGNETSKHTGFTWDLSYTGLFVSCNVLPKLGEPLTVVLQLPDGKKVELHGKAVRGRQVPASLAYTEPNGFSLAISSYSEEYTKFLSAFV